MTGLLELREAKYGGEMTSPDTVTSLEMCTLLVGWLSQGA